MRFALGNSRQQLMTLRSLESDMHVLNQFEWYKLISYENNYNIESFLKNIVIQKKDKIFFT
jgi:hypothetical protein